MRSLWMIPAVCALAVATTVVAKKTRTTSLANSRGSNRVISGAARSDYDRLKRRRLTVPIPGLDPAAIRETFDESRNGRRHEATDIAAPRGTPVVAVDDGSIRKLFISKQGGLTVYQFDPEETYCYYYAHLDRYADGVYEGKAIKKGELLGYVGSTGNASPEAPHLHFAIFRLDPEKRWWKGTPIDPYPFLTQGSG